MIDVMKFVAVMFESDADSVVELSTQQQQGNICKCVCTLAECVCSAMRGLNTQHCSVSHLLTV